MFYVVHETIQMATEELAEHLRKDTQSIDAQMLVPFVVLIVVETFMQIQREGKLQFNMRVFLVMMEYFTVHEFGMSQQDYSFVTFKEVEKILT